MMITLILRPILPSYLSYHISTSIKDKYIMNYTFGRYKFRIEEFLWKQFFT